MRLVRFGALVQQSNAVESLSNVDTLILDKTGTLTANRLKVAGVYAPDGRGQDRLVEWLATLAASATASNKTGQAIAEAFPGTATPLLAEVPFSSGRKWSAFTDYVRLLAARDRKLRRQLRAAALSLGEGAKALAGGRRKPSKRRGRRLVMLLGIGALGTGVALAASEDLRSSLFGSASHSKPTPEGS